MTQPTSTTDPTPPAGSRDSLPHRYDARLADEIEGRWQAYWEANATFHTKNPGEPGFDASRPRFYCLDMFPYPSGAGLHVGHPEGYTATDIICRYHRHRGRTVLHPMGWDAFGLPAEQYAIQTGVHPAITTKQAIDNFRRQLKRFGFSYDWSREFATIDPEYYRWTQWIWLKAYDAWYDHDAQRARPIDELLEGLASGARVVDDENGVVLPAAGGRAWNDLSADERRAVIDGQRLAYLGEQTVNWCPKLGTVLANEEVIDGRSERGGFPVLRKPLRQWMFRITAFADRLLADLSTVDWPESTRQMQAEWIGRSEGAEIDFPVEDATGDVTSLRVYTTRPDTVFGATFMVVAPEHPLVAELLRTPRPDTDVDALGAYMETARNRADVDRMADTREKTGVFTGAYAKNPATGKRIPIWTADYVLMGYGHGAIMAVPAHDQRDYEFAERFELPIVQVVRPVDGDAPAGEAFAGDGVAANSANDTVSLDGLDRATAIGRITTWLETQGLGRHRVNFKLRDWLFSRQRYWGEPFPIVFDADGNHHPVAESNLPVVLPGLEDYHPIESDEPVPLLAKATAWVETTAGAAGVDPSNLPPDTPVRRETNTMPGWAGSCWYYLRFCDPSNNDRFVGRDAERYWLGEGAGGGVDLYVGGAEHAVLHLLYARFWHKLLGDLGEVSTPEPFRRLFHQGLITSYAFQRADKTLVPTNEVTEVSQDDAVSRDPEARADADGKYWMETATSEILMPVTAKMSKSLRNVVSPDEIITTYGADTFRLYEMYMGPLEAMKPWRTADIVGPFRFLQRLWRLVVDERTGELILRDERDEAIDRQLHRTIEKVGEDIERLAFNTAIAAMIELVNAASKAGGLTRDQLARFATIVSPFAPHVAEELWARLGNTTSITHESWPAVDPALLVDDTIELPVQIRGKVRGRITVPASADDDTVRETALNDERIKSLLEGATVRKVIVVPGKIVNVIV